MSTTEVNQKPGTAIYSPSIRARLRECSAANDLMAMVRIWASIPAIHSARLLVRTNVQSWNIVCYDTQGKKINLSITKKDEHHVHLKNGISGIDVLMECEKLVRMAHDSQTLSVLVPLRNGSAISISVISLRKAVQSLGL